uniref:Protein kinase domain-containing protein n=1 Tax=Salix viminalis TaxID=40686 RepID=A0A6N2KKF1_SALVM
MPNGSLGRSDDIKLLDSPSRYKIALGAARGISYLHHDCIPHIIHPDSNSCFNNSSWNFWILSCWDVKALDNCKFCLFLYRDLIINISKHVFSAEYFERGKVAVKEDVYSFGVVLLELLTGMKPTGEELFNWERVPQLLVSSSICLKPPNITYIDMEKAVVEDKRQEYVLDSSLKCSPTEENKNSISCALNQSPPRDLHGRDCQDA